MAQSPIRIAAELTGIEPSERLQAALDELAAAAEELIRATAEVSGYYLGTLENEGVGWSDMRPEVKTWSFGIDPNSSKNMIDTEDIFPAKEV